MIKKNKIYKLLSKDWVENYILTVKLLKENKEDKRDKFHNTNVFNASRLKILIIEIQKSQITNNRFGKKLVISINITIKVLVSLICKEL